MRLACFCVDKKGGIKCGQNQAANWYRGCITAQPSAGWDLSDFAELRRLDYAIEPQITWKICPSEIIESTDKPQAESDWLL